VNKKLSKINQKLLLIKKRFNCSDLERNVLKKQSNVLQSTNVYG